MTANPASRWDAADYAACAAFVPALGAPVVALLDPRPGERVLDLGCGDGVLTWSLIDAGAEVTAVDASPEMVAAARAAGVSAAVADGQALAFGAAFDAVFSNAALHWMLDAAAVARGVFAALKPGGRFVGEMGGEGNVAAIRAALYAELRARGRVEPPQAPQWYPSIAEFTDTYADAGFVDIDARLIPRPTPLPAGVSGWLRTFRTGFLDALGVAPAEQDAIARAVEARLGPGFVADYVRLRFSCRKPA